MENKIEEYFQAFSDKDVDKLEKLYDDDVSLRDWLTSAEGKEAVIESNQRLFDAVSTVDIKLKNMIWRRGRHDVFTASCEIDINLKHNDGTEDKLLVVDIIEMKDDRIKEIRAYLGNV